MSTAEEQNNTSQTSIQSKIEQDQWIFGSQGLGKNARWFALSMAAHVLALAMLATFTLTMAQQQDLIKVKAMPFFGDEQQQASSEEDILEDWEGEPSLQDLPGLLTMEEIAPTNARTPAAPRPGEVESVRPAALPVLTGLGAAMAVGTQFEGITTQLGNLSGAVGGLGGGFGDAMGGLRKAGLDMVLVIDTSDSTQFVSNTVKQRLTKLVAAIRGMVPISRIGVVAYRDRGDEYVTKWADLSFSVPKLQGFVGALESGGGGDWPEAVYEALEVAVNDMRWRKMARRIIILIPASPPHPDTVGNVLALAQRFHAQDGSLSVVDLAEQMHEEFERALWKQSAHLSNVAFKSTPLPGFYREFRDTMASIARAGGGEFIPFTDEKALTRQIVFLTFGTRWRAELAKYLRDLE